MNRPERLTLAQCHTGILALGVDADDRPFGGKQIGNDRPDALARARRGDGEEMGGAIIAKHPAKCVAPDQQIAKDRILANVEARFHPAEYYCGEVNGASLGLALKCLEPAFAIGCGLMACASVSPDAGILAGALIGGAGLVTRVKEHFAKHGLDAPALNDKIQKKILREWDVDRSEADSHALTIADYAMSLHLAECMLSQEQLAATSISIEHYPALAARQVVDNLAERDEMFAASADNEQPLARRFALSVIETCFNAAKDDKDYAILLTLDLVIAGNAAHAVTHEKLDEQSGLLRNLLAAVQPKANAQNVTDVALIELARRVAEKVGDQVQALATLELAIDELVSLRDAAARGTNLGNLIDEALRRAVAYNEQGRFDEAAKVLADEYARLQAKEDELRQGKLTIVESAINQARLQVDADEAARWVIERLTLEMLGGMILDSLLEEQERWHCNGETLALTFDLEVAVLLARGAIQCAKTPNERADSQNRLAIALFTQGERTGGDLGLKLLTEAETAYKEVITVYTFNEYPLKWAGAQNNLGAVLRSHGVRTEDEAGRELLANAVRSFHEALTVFTEETTPTQWAGAANNLGIALQSQGERTRGADGVWFLEAALVAYRNALRVHTVTDMPDQWAATQENLGTALRALGERAWGQEGLMLLAGATVAHRNSLTVRSKTAMPTAWASSQSNLADALRTQGERTRSEAGLALLAEAVAAYRAALTIWTPEVSSHWHEMFTRNLNRTESLMAARRQG